MSQADSFMQPESPRSSIAGPRHRESFLDAQRRNRHATWRLSAVSAIAAVIMGIPLALTITPLLYAVGLMVADIVSLWTPLPAAFWQFANAIGQYGTTALLWLLQGKSTDPQTLAVGGAVLLLPGALLSLGLWRGVNALFRRSGVGGALLALKAREPNPSELSELRLADVVQEMAIAAGLPAPRIMLIDSTAANAAAIGTSPDNARIVVSRGLIEQLSRDELEGVLAHLVASIGNGDLRIAFRVTSVFETCGLLVALINAPFGPHARRTLWRVVRYGFSLKKKDDAAGAAEADTLASLLTRGGDMEFDDINTLFDSGSSKHSVLRSIRNFLLFPIFLTNATIKLSLWFFSFSTLGPSIALLWRKRVYLADACAVQLTRNPDGLAEALRKLNSSYARIPGGEWASHLFLVNPGGSDRMGDAPANTPQQQVLARAWAASAITGSAPLRFSDPAHVMQEVMTTGRAAMAGDQQAMARMLAFRQAAAKAFGISEAEMPGLEDLAAAQHGDVRAMRRLQDFGKKMEGRANRESSSSKSNPSSGFAGFHPSLKRRLKRLDRMGAHIELEATDRKIWMFIAFLAVVLGPFALLALVLLLVLIGILTLTSLTFIAFWMAVIHQVFVVFAHH